MNRNFKFSHGMAASQVAHRIAGQKEDHTGLGGHVAQHAQGVALVGRKAVLQ